jgi:hypothetical protein
MLKYQMVWDLYALDLIVIAAAVKIVQDYFFAYRLGSNPLPTPDIS